MSKVVEEYIKKHTRNCSNEIGYCHNKTRNHNHVFYPWLTPSQAEYVAQIAREETIEEVCEWLKKNVTYMHPRKEEVECVVNIARLKDDLGV